MTQPKVFGVGFQKTGTTSLGTIFSKLGYDVLSYSAFRHLADRDDLSWDEVTALALELAAGADAAKDTPWPLLYKELDAAFPGSKFIHVTRDTSAWLNSAVNDFQSHPNAIHRLIYGSDGPVGHEEVWTARYEAHNAEVAAYFADRPDDYLHLRLEDGVTYEKVCPFLGAPLVGTGAPKANTRGKKKLKMLWWRLFGGQD
ncbi:MAG: sulfotransferase [Rhodobacter sp.]|nr:sulfotransferase [Rhodobacter sp.]